MPTIRYWSQHLSDKPQAHGFQKPLSCGEDLLQLAWQAIDRALMTPNLESAGSARLVASLLPELPSAEGAKKPKGRALA